MADLERTAVGWEGWFVTVTGPLAALPNALVPSADDALTHANVRRRAARAQARAAGCRRPGRGGPPHGGGYTTLFTDEVSAGVVTWATWMLIRALPPAARAEYEGLRVDSAVFYPRAFVADSGPGFDALRARLATGRDADWAQALDLDARRRVTVDDLDEAYAALRYPVGVLADRLVAARRAAKAAGERGLDRFLKLTANTVYGVLASAHVPTQNVVAAQVVTGTARALAYAMAQSLNCFNVITGGVIYRADEVPAGTFADCVAACPDYPIRRPDGGVPFLPASRVPAGDAAFTE